MELPHCHVLGVFERGHFEEAVQEDYAAQNVLSGKFSPFFFLLFLASSHLPKLVFPLNLNM